MTTPSGTELTDEEIDDLVMEELGWVWFENSNQHGYWQFPSDRTRDVLGYLSPKFSTSRDACATFEVKIHDRRIYNMNLEEAVREHFPDWRIMDPEERFFEVVTAKPRQRCISFLRMKGVL